MTPDPSVGVVVAAFNAERWLTEALDSILVQDRAADVVVVDDGSTDATADIAAGYGPPVRLLRQVHAGIGAARNLGVTGVRGELLAFLDADDRFTRHGLDLRIDHLVSHPDVDIAFGYSRRFRATVDGVPQPASELQAAEMPGAMVVRRPALERVGRFRTDVRVSEGMQWLLRARELKVSEVTLPEQVYWRRVHDDNNSLRNRAALSELAQAIKASLDRRRAAPGLEGR